MQEVFEKLKQRIRICATEACGYTPLTRVVSEAELKDIIEQIAAEYINGHFGCNTNGEHERCDGCGLTDCKSRNKIWFGVLDDNNGWILCEVKMPPVETEVFILAKRKFKNGDYKYIRTTAMYEDGTVLENDSSWGWEDIEGEWDKENDCYIIPEGWWENRHYNPDEVYNNAVDDEVIAWHPLPDPYNTSICKDTNCPYNNGNECPAADGCAGYERKRTNFDMCCESMEAMAQIIDIAKIGWTKDKIMEWLQSEVEE